MKTKPYSANKAKLFVTDFFFSNEPYLCLSEKGILRCMWRDLGMNLPLLVTFVCISYFSSQIYINPTSDAFLVSRGEKKLTNFGYISSVIQSYLKTGKIAHNFF